MKLPRKTAEMVIKVWQQEGMVLDVLLEMSGIKRGDDIADWEILRTNSGLPIEQSRYVKMPIRAWLSNQFVNASNEMWLNHPNKALRWMLTGDDYGTVSRPARAAMKAAVKDAAYKLVRMRDLDKRHDWNTCK